MHISSTRWSTWMWLGPFSHPCFIQKATSIRHLVFRICKSKWKRNEKNWNGKKSRKIASTRITAHPHTHAFFCHACSRVSRCEKFRRSRLRNVFFFSACTNLSRHCHSQTSAKYMHTIHTYVNSISSHNSQSLVNAHKCARVRDSPKNSTPQHKNAIQRRTESITTCTWLKRA